MHPSDSDFKVPGKVLPMRWDTKPTTPREVVVGEKIVTILKEMLESWRLPKALGAR